MDQEALKAVYRALKPGGLLVISYLPYRWSWREWRERARGAGYQRLYGWDETATLLKRHGFLPLALRFQAFIPNVVDGKASSPLKRALAPIRYPWFRHDVLCCAARKVIVM